MNHTPLLRAIIILLFIMVIGTFFVGTMLTFAPVQAAIVLEAPVQKVVLPTSTAPAEIPLLGSTPTILPALLLTSPTGEAPAQEAVLPTLVPPDLPNITDVPSPSTSTPSADTTGIIALSILLVVVVLVGTLVGERRPRNNKETKE